MIQRFIKKIFNVSPQFKTLNEKTHGLSPHDLPNGALQVVETLQDAGYEAFLVGGAVRDLLLSRTPKDFDVATNATPEQIKRLFRRAYIIGRRFRIVHVHIGAELIEVSTFRSARENNHTDEHGRILSDNAFGSHLEDASRRDFTVNALYYDPTDNLILDAHEGYQDLQKKRLRLIGKAAVRFREDPVRILRILRFTAKLDFSMDKATKTTAQQLCHLLDMVPSARLADEFSKFLLGGYSLKGLQLLASWQLLHRFLHININTADEGLSPLQEESLRRADRRHANEQGLSLSFLMAALLWSNVKTWEKDFSTKGLPAAIAFQDAMNETVHLQQQKVFLTKSIVGEMRDIWTLQKHLLFPRSRQVARLLSNRKLTTAIDFLELQSHDHPVNLPVFHIDRLSEITYPSIPTESLSSEHCGFWAHWWRALISAYPDEQKIFIHHWEKAYFEAMREARLNLGNKSGFQKKSRPRKPRAPKSFDDIVPEAPPSDLHK